MGKSWWCVSFFVGYMYYNFIYLHLFGKHSQFAKRSELKFSLSGLLSALSAS